MNQIIIGFGEIGKAVAAVIGETHIEDRSLNRSNNLVKNVEIMHICFPYTAEFEMNVDLYIRKYKPKHVIIYSTVPIGTSKQLGAVHSPIEGKHPDLEMSIRQMERWIGTEDYNEGLFFANYFRELGLWVRLIKDSNYTEALKLLSTTEYGINIEFARYKAHVAEEIGMDYELTKEWNRVYNKLYRDLGLEKTFQKFVLDAPNGPKGGHCITPNAVLLDEQYPNDMVKVVGEIL